MSNKKKRSSSKSRFSKLSIETLEPRQLLSADPLISEFMASNSKTLTDYYGKNPDWLEIYNPDTAAVDLAGWQLKRDGTTWSIPSGVSLESKSYLVIYCDEKNLVDPAGKLHTNFKLGASGDYLALLKSDNTVVSEYSPEYPQQIADISYGLSDAYVTNSTFSTNAESFVYSDNLYSSNGDANLSNGAYSSTGGNLDGCLSVTTTMSSSKTVNGGFAKNITISASDTYTFSVDAKIDMSCTNATNNLTPSDTGTAYLIVKNSIGTVLLTQSLVQAGNNTKSCSSAWTTLSGNLTLPAGTYTINLCLLDSKRVTNTGPKYINATFDNFYVLSTSATSMPQYLTTPTPGAANSTGNTNIGPYVNDVTDKVAQPTVGDTLTITAKVNPSLRAINTVQLAYRVMFGSETTVAMYDNGTNGDAISGDDIYTALLPTTSMSAGQMLRWRVIATDINSVQTTGPAYNDPLNSEQYYGTVVVADIDTQLPVVQFFVNGYTMPTDTGSTQTTVDTDAGARGTIYYNGELYDNVLIRIKGMASRYMFKRSHHIDFNADHKFLWEEGQPRVSTAMFNAEYQDPSYVRQFLSQWLQRDSGTGAMPDFPARLQMNGEFWQLAFFNLPASESLLDVLGYDPNGAMYKFIYQVEPGNPEKRTREWENNADYNALASAITRNPDAQRAAAVYDMLDLPQVINYIAMARIVMECDDVWANMTIYRDSDGDGLWRIIPYDLNLSFGQMYAGEYWENSGIHATDDHLKAHPLYGDREHLVIYHSGFFDYNQIYDAIMMDPTMREMLLRRMRSLMDEYLQPPDTPYANRSIENMLDDLVARIETEANMDRAKWGWPPQGGVYGMGTPSFSQAISDIKTQYLDPRRTHMYIDHSLNTSYPNYAGIPSEQQDGLIVNFGSYEVNPVSGNQEEEYLTLVNPNSVAVDISGWKLSGGIEFTFASGTIIPAGGTLYVSPNTVAFKQRATGPTGGQGLYVLGGYNGRLSLQGESIQVLDTKNNVVNTLTTPANPSLAQQYLRITEIMYHPADPTSGTYTNDDFEFIELTNTSTTQTLDLTGVRFTEGTEFEFTGSNVTSLAPGGKVLIVSNLPAFQSRYGTSLNGIIAGQYGMVTTTSLDPTHLSNSGEKITLVDSVGETILSFAYNDSWYKQTDGSGNSLVIRDAAATDRNLWDQREGWAASQATTGSPGTDETPQYAADVIVINELLNHQSDSMGDWVEFRNTTGSSINIGGWYLSNDDADLKKYQIPAGTIIPALGYKAFNWRDNFGSTANAGCITPFTLGEMGGTVYLTSATSSVFTSFQVSEDFGSSDTGVTLGRYIKSTGGKDFVAMSTPTYETANSLPKVGPVVINEIYYHPDSGQNAFIELKNITSSEVELYDPALPDNTWHLAEGVKFTFPEGAVISANGYALIVECDPEYFRTKYNIPGSVPVYGPYIHNLNKAGDTIELKYPDDPQPDGDVPYDRMDQVTYGDSGLWSNLADGGGASLDRISATSYGNDASNWTAGYPTPGAVNSDFENDPITIVTPASASPSTVTGTTTNLSVLGDYAQGESNIVYCWNIISKPAGAATPTFTINNSNAAKNTTATFYSEGTYTFTVTLADLFINDYAITSEVVEVTVVQSLTSVSIIPAAVNLYPGSTQQFSVAAFDQFGNIMGTPLSDVTWSVYSGIGTISSSGLYTAPTDGSGIATIRAITSIGQIFFADATITSDAVWYPANDTSGTILADASGNGKDATLTGAAGFGVGMSGNALNLTGGYASLPTGVLSTLNDFTIAAWVKIDTLSTWSRIFDFGTGTSVNMFLTPLSGSSNLRFAITTSGGGGEQQINSTSALATGSWQHVAVTLSGNTGTLYVNGAVVGTNTAMTLRPSSLGSTTQNYLGKSQYPDPAFLGSIDDFRIIGQALSADEIQKFVYPSIATAATASSITSTSANLSVLGGDVTNGESTLLYTWSVTGTPPSPVTFSANDTNAAKNTIANFTEFGTYNFLVTVTNPAGYSTTSTLSVDVLPSALIVVPENLPSTGPANMTLTIDGDGNLHIYQTGSTTDIVAPMPFDMVSNISIVGRDNFEDALTIDFAEGNPIPMGGATFNGGSGSGNSLIINGTSATDTLMMNASQIVVDSSSPIGYLNTAYFAFYLGGGADSLTLDHATLMLLQDNAISAGTSVTIDGGILNLNGKTDTISDITMTSGSIVNGTLLATTYNVESGSVTAMLVGSGNLNKTTTGQATAGVINTSNVTINAGQLTATSINSGILTIAAGATLTIAPIAGGPLAAYSDLTPLAALAVPPTSTKTIAQPTAADTVVTSSATDTTVVAAGPLATSIILAVSAPVSRQTASALTSADSTSNTSFDAVATPTAFVNDAVLPMRLVESTSVRVIDTVVNRLQPQSPNYSRLDSTMLHRIIESGLEQSLAARNGNVTSTSILGSPRNELSSRVSKIEKHLTTPVINSRQAHLAAFQTVLPNSRWTYTDAEVDFDFAQHIRAGKHSKQLENAIDEVLAEEDTIPLEL